MNGRLLRYQAFLTAGVTFVLVWVGGLVTSHGAGMAVPDWPNTYGYNMFFFPISKWIGGIFYEHTHRLIASGVGLLTTILALWLYGTRARPLLLWGGSCCVLAGLACLWSFPKYKIEDWMLTGFGVTALGVSFWWPNREPSPLWLRRLGLIAFVAVVIQGLLGGFRVTQMMNQLGIFHATLAQMFFVVVSAIALFLTPYWRALPKASRPDWRNLRGWIGVLTLVILVQLILGATMRHQHAGLAIPDFPAAYGKLWPATDAKSIESYNQSRIEAEGYEPITAFQVWLQMAHRLVAYSILVFVFIILRRTWLELGRKHRVTCWASAWAAVVSAQAVLGAFTIWTGKSADIATLHVAFGALSLLIGGLFYLVAARTLKQPEFSIFDSTDIDMGFAAMDRAADLSLRR